MLSQPELLASFPWGMNMQSQERASKFAGSHCLSRGWFCDAACTKIYKAKSAHEAAVASKKKGTAAAPTAKAQPAKALALVRSPGLQMLHVLVCKRVQAQPA